MKREAFLTRVRWAAGAIGEPDPGPYAHPPVGRPGDEGTRARFKGNLEAVGGTLHEAATAQAAASLIADVMHNAGAAEFLSWDEAHLPLPGVLNELTRLGLRRAAADLPTEIAARRAHLAGYYDSVLGLTGAAAGLAETGSVVLASGPGRSRMASLIAEIHIALLAADKLFASLSAWAAEHPDALAACANWTVITGPSRTADIEQILTRGVHGPREVHVVLVDAPRPG